MLNIEEEADEDISESVDLNHENNNKSEGVNLSVSKKTK
jgi:hypothetical protein